MLAFALLLHGAAPAGLEDLSGSDKVLHSAACAAVTLGGYGGAAALDASLPARLLWGAGAGAAAGLAKEGADLLVHSVTDKLVDEASVRLLREKGTILTPTLVVFERYGRSLAQARQLLDHLFTQAPPEPEAEIRSALASAMMTPDTALSAAQRDWLEVLRR